MSNPRSQHGHLETAPATPSSGVLTPVGLTTLLIASLLIPARAPARELPAETIARQGENPMYAEGRLLVKVRTSEAFGRELPRPDREREWSRLLGVRAAVALFPTSHPFGERLSRTTGNFGIPLPIPDREGAARQREEFGLDRWLSLQLEEGEPVAVALARLRRDPRVEVVEPDHIGHAASYIPGDPRFGDQWYLDQVSDADIDMPEAWETARDARAVPVAVLDSGVQTDHPDLQGALLPGWDFVNDDDDPTDDNGHGTHVTGLIAARSDNATGIAGAAFLARVMPLKVLDENLTGYYSDWAAGFYHCALYGVRIANLSAGGSSPSTFLYDAIRFARARGVVIFAAMMNYGDDLPRYPAFYDETIAVGATDRNDSRADPFGSNPADASSYGAHIDLVAPGDGLISTYNRSNYALGWGTSQATPLVSAVGALILALAPDLAVNQVRSILRASADDGVGRPTEDTAGFDIYHGWGRLNAEAALAIVVNSRTDAWGSLTRVYPPRPNPSPGTVGFRYDLGYACPVTIRIYDVRGRLVHVLLDRAPRSRGTHLDTWDGRDTSGERVAGGVYLFVLLAGSERFTGKIIRF